MMSRTIPVILLCLLITRLTRAEPLDRRQLPAATTWFVHLDVDAAKSSSFVQSAYAAWSNQPEVRKAIEKARRATGMDLTREIRSMTLYGSDYLPNQTVLIVRGKVDRPRLEGLLKKAPGYRHELVEGHEVHFWTEIAGSAKASRCGAFARDDTVAISPDVKTLLSALEVLAEKTPSLARDSALRLQWREGAFFQAAAAGFAEAKNLPLQSPILRQCKSGSIVLGEQEGSVFFHGSLVARSAVTAAQVKSAIQLWRGFALRKAGENPQTALPQSLSAEENDQTVDVNWTFAAMELVKMIDPRQSSPPPEIAREKVRE